MPVELLYLWGVTIVVIGIGFLLTRRLRHRKTALLHRPADGRSPWLSRLQNWLLSPPGTEPAELATGEAAAEPTAVAAAAGELTLAQVRIPAAALLLGGSLLVLMGLTIRTGLPPTERNWLWGIMGLGGLAFVAAGQLVNQRRLPPGLMRLARWASRFLEVSGGQLVLLALAPVFVLLAYLAAGDLLQARHGLIATTSWLLAVALAVGGSWALGKRELPQIGWHEMIFTAVLLAVAFALRGTNLAGMPNTLSGDEAASGLVALLFRNGEANNLFTFGWFSFPSLYFVIQSVGLRVWGQTTEGLRVSSAVGGALAVVAVYWLARVMFDRLTAVFASIYLAASHYHIHISRNGLNNVWDSLFGALAIMGLWHGWKTGRRSSFILAGVALGLGQYFYVSIRVLPLLFLVWAGVAFWQDRETFRKRLPGLMLTAFIALIVILPFAIQVARHWDNFMAPLSRVSVFSGDWLPQAMAQNEQTAVQVITGQMLTTALGFTHQPLRLLYNPGSALLLGGAAALFLMGIFWAVMHFDLKYLLITLPLLAVIISGGFSHNPPASQRFIMAMPLVAIMVVLPLRLAGDWLAQLWPRARNLLVIGLSLVLAVIIWTDLHYYFFEVYDTYVLGGGNTEVATQVAYYLRDHEIPEQKVYFFGFPRMGYFSLATIQFLAPRMDGEDVIEPLSAPPDWGLEGPTLFLFLPERLPELDWVRMRYPDGRYREFFSDKGTMLFAAYEVVPDG